MLLFDGRRQHDDLACAARRQCKASLRRAHVRQRPKLHAKPPDFDPQPCAMRIHRRASPGRRERRACPSARLRARLRPARVQARTIPGASRARPPCLRPARHGGTRPRRAPLTPAALRPPRAGGAAPRHARSGAPRACPGRGMRFRPPPSARGCPPRARPARPERAQRAPPSSEGAGSRFRQPPARGRPSTRAGAAWGRARRAMRSASSRRPIRSRRRTSRLPRMRGIQAVAVRFERRPRCVERLRRPARGRARRARSRPRRRRTSRGPPPLSDRRRAQHFAGAPLLERDRRAAPSRCLAARAQARRHAGRPASMRRGDRPPRAHAPRP